MYRIPDIEYCTNLGCLLCYYTAVFLADLSWLLSVLWYHPGKDVQGILHIPQPKIQKKTCKCAYYKVLSAQPCFSLLLLLLSMLKFQPCKKQSMQRQKQRLLYVYNLLYTQYTRQQYFPQSNMYFPIIYPTQYNFAYTTGGDLL